MWVLEVFSDGTGFFTTAKTIYSCHNSACINVCCVKVCKARVKVTHLKLHSCHNNDNVVLLKYKRITNLFHLFYRIEFLLEDAL